MSGQCLSSFLCLKKCITKYLNNDLKPLADAQFPDRGPICLGKGSELQQRPWWTALKSIQFQKRFSWSDGSKYKSQSRCHKWGGECLYPTSKSLCSSNHERQYLGYEATMLHTMSS